jgi:PAS domain S-box-containing protein
MESTRVTGGRRSPLAPHLLRIVILPLALLLTLSALLFWQVRHLVAQTMRVEQISEVLTQGNAVYRRIVDQETGLRGYLLVGDDTFLEPYQSGHAQVQPELRRLEEVVADSPSQRKIIEDLRATHEAWQRDADAAIRARAVSRATPATTREMLLRKRQMDDLRARFETFLQNEERLRDAQIDSARQQTDLSLGMGAIVFALLVTVVMLASRRSLLDVEASYRRATEAEGRLRRLWDSNIIGVMYGDMSGHISDANDALLRMIGYSREDLAAGLVRWPEMTPPEYVGLDAERGAESMQRGACTPYEKAYVRKDGRRVPILLGYARLEGPGTEHICFVIDLTERARAEKALADQHDVTWAITDNATAALFMEDEQGRCVFMNPAAEAMIGFSLEEIGNRSLHEVIHFERSDGRPYPLAGCPIHGAQLGKAGVRGHEDVFVRNGGERFPVICAASPILSGGRQIATVLEARDVTEQKQIEADREYLLDSERAARTAAERDARIKDEFLAVLSHELRTPLNAVLGWASMLRKGTLDAAGTARALEVIERNAEAEVRLIEDLLDVSRISSGKLRLNVQQVELADVVETAASSLLHAVEAKRIRLDMALDQAVGAVMADTSRILQVVWNLLANAIKFTPMGGRVAVVLQRVSSSVEIVVSDTGQGIEADFLPHVFERFRQADSSTTRRHAGLGLGLTLVRNLVELHGGHVRVESKGEGHGATFTVSLPVAVIRWSSPEDRVPRDPCESLRGVRVLVVDDEADTRELVRRLLADCNAEVVTVESAQDALEEVWRFRPDVLLSDIGMPQQDGYQLMRTLRGRSVEQGGRTPAIALTAFARPEDRMRALRAGYQLHVSKPVNANELITVVASLACRPEAPPAGTS